MPRKKKAEEMVQASLGHRISKHEAICAERMKRRRGYKRFKTRHEQGKGSCKRINIFSRIDCSYCWFF
jgi:uncharacterized Fe-S cluster-containing radical SAM superfamily protein